MTQQVGKRSSHTWFVLKYPHPGLTDNPQIGGSGRPYSSGGWNCSGRFPYRPQQEGFAMTPLRQKMIEDMQIGRLCFYSLGSFDVKLVTP